jgi:hypothetical protein
MASGSGVSAARALTSDPVSRSKASVTLFGNDIAHSPNLPSLRGTTCPPSEGGSNEAIQSYDVHTLDCFAEVAMTV